MADTYGRGSSNRFGGGGFQAAIDLETVISGTGDVAALDAAFEKLSRSTANATAEMLKGMAAANDSTKAYQVVAGAAAGVIGAYETLDDQVGNVTATMMKNAAAATWMARQTEALNSTLEELAAHERTAATAQAPLQAATAKTGDAIKDAGEKSNKYGAMKFLFLSNALQDVQYGMQAIQNNIPQLVMSFGGSAGVAGAAQAALVAVGLLANKLGSIGDIFGAGFAQALPNDMKKLKDVIDEINARPLKVAADFEQITNAQRALDQLSAAQAAFDRLKNKKSVAQQEMGKRATEAIVEYGGGDDYAASVEKVAGAAEGLTKVVDSLETTKLRKSLADTVQNANDAIDPDAAFSMRQEAAELEKRLESSVATDRNNHKAYVQGRVGQAAEGRSEDIDWLLGLARQHPDVFANRGVEEGFVQALGKSTRDTVRNDAFDKNQKAIDATEQKRQDKEITAADAEQKRAVAAGVKAVQGGVDDKLEDDLTKQFRGGKSRDQAVKDAMRGLMPILEQRQVPLWVRQAVAEQLANTAADKAANLVQEGGKTKLETKAEQAQRKADADAKHGQTERQARIGKAVSSVQDGYDDTAVTPYFEGLKGGQAAGQITAREAPMLRKALTDRGDVAGDIVDDVVRSILEKAEAKARNLIDSGQIPTKMKAADAAIAKGAARVEKGFLPQAEELYARNQNAVLHNAPVARTMAQAQHFQGMGQPFALSREGIHDYIEAEVARRLQASGQDPRGAGDITAKAIEHVDSAYAKGVAQTGSQFMAMAEVVQQTQSIVAGLQQQMSAQGSVIGKLRGNNAKLQQGQRQAAAQFRRSVDQRPSLLTNIPSFGVALGAAALVGPQAEAAPALPTQAPAVHAALNPGTARKIDERFKAVGEGMQGLRRDINRLGGGHRMLFSLSQRMVMQRPSLLQ